jgi:hypothetical protein
MEVGTCALPANAPIEHRVTSLCVRFSHQKYFLGPYRPYGAFLTDSIAGSQLAWGALSSEAPLQRHKIRVSPGR